MIIIDGKRWFDRRYGNTYHSVSVTVDGKHIGNMETNTFKPHTPCCKMRESSPKTGMSVGYSNFLSDRMANREKYHITVADVSRKGGLK